MRPKSKAAFRTRDWNSERSVSINFLVPRKLKEDFDELCNKKRRSATSILNELMDRAVKRAAAVFLLLLFTLPGYAEA